MPLSYDPAEAVQTLRQSDPLLAALMERAGPCTLEAGSLASPFQALLRSIIYQQLAGRAAATIHGRVLALFGEEHPTPEQLLAMPEDDLRGAGLSRSKLAAARDLAAKTLEGVVPQTEDALLAMPDDEIVQRLTAVRGIGPWTVEMLLIFHLGRPDVLPVTDFGVQTGFMLLHGHDALPTPTALRQHGECWRPFRSVASWYLWRAVDLHRAQ
jgi:DNA-3-methyladenine glycosylase II